MNGDIEEYENQPKICEYKHYFILDNHHYMFFPTNSMNHQTKDKGSPNPEI